MREALIFLAAAVVCVPIAKRFGLGSVLGYLIAGAAIGPWGLGLISDTDSTQNLAELGVVLMLFVIGLELDPKRFLADARRGLRRRDAPARRERRSCWASPSTSRASRGRRRWSADLSLALSSTAIAMQALTERNELNTPTGQRCVRDPSLPGHRGDPADRPRSVRRATSRWRDPIRCGCAWALPRSAIAGVVVIGRYLTRPILRLIAKTELREVFTAFALLAGPRHRGADVARGAFHGARRLPRRRAARELASSATRWKATSSRSRDCCWVSSSSPWA